MSDERQKTLYDAKTLLDRAGSCLGQACMRLGLKEHPLDNKAKADLLIKEARDKAARGLKMIEEQPEGPFDGIKHDGDI